MQFGVAVVSLLCILGDGLALGATEGQLKRGLGDTANILGPYDLRNSSSSSPMIHSYDLRH